MKLEVKDNCPLNGFEPCKKFDCAWFIQLRGTDPNTGEEVDDWGCSMAFMPILLIENAQQSRQTGAAVESFRNEMVKANDLNRDILAAQAQPKQRLEAGE
ncbi:hypothetical protein OAE49_06210 [Gammaproteobacteria bacterium]|nr:hypothetical protein [Gammaproteobacteria bacterium]